MGEHHSVNVSDILSFSSTFGIVLVLALFTCIRFGIFYKFKQNTRPLSPPWDVLNGLLETLVQVGVVVFLLIRPYAVQAFYIPSSSMENTLIGHNAGMSASSGTEHLHTVHDHIIVDKFIYLHSNPKRGDIVVFRAPPSAVLNSSASGKTFIKRCIGIPGDTIQIVEQDGQDYVKRNGTVLHEYHNPNLPYSIKQRMSTSFNYRFKYAFPDALHLKSGEYFMMGDNSNNSDDSRFWGVVHRWRFIGKAEVIFWPLNRARILH